MTLSATDRHLLKLADDFVSESEGIRDRRIEKYFPIGSWVQTLEIPAYMRGQVYEIDKGNVYFSSRSGAGGKLFCANHSEVEPCPAPMRKIVQPKTGGKVCRKKK